MSISLEAFLHRYPLPDPEEKDPEEGDGDEKKEEVEEPAVPIGPGFHAVRDTTLFLDEADFERNLYIDPARDSLELDDGIHFKAQKSIDKILFFDGRIFLCFYVRCMVVCMYLYDRKPYS